MLILEIMHGTGGIEEEFLFLNPWTPLYSSAEIVSYETLRSLIVLQRQVGK